MKKIGYILIHYIFYILLICFILFFSSSTYKDKVVDKFFGDIGVGGTQLQRTTIQSQPNQLVVPFFRYNNGFNIVKFF